MTVSQATGRGGAGRWAPAVDTDVYDNMQPPGGEDELVPRLQKPSCGGGEGGAGAAAIAIVYCVCVVVVAGRASITRGLSYNVSI